MNSEDASVISNEPTPSFVDIIWNITLVCPWDCSICCVDAVHVTRRGSSVHMTSHGLQQSQQVPINSKLGSIYEQAAAIRVAQGLELSYEDKIAVLNNLAGYKPKLDFSGGDPLVVAENFRILSIASERFGREQITLTATGAGLDRYASADIAPLIGELNFTFDGVERRGSENRPDGYAATNLARASRFALAGVRTRAECPLTKRNIDHTKLRQLYLMLRDGGIDSLLLMRLFPVGRGITRQHDIPSVLEYRQAIRTLREMEELYGSPRLKLQCALKRLDNWTAGSRNPCDAVTESFGLMPNGTLLASPWAINEHSMPMDECWILGNLAKTPLKEILKSNRALEYLKRAEQNTGHCKIFAYLYSKRPISLDRIFDEADPLYTP